MEIIRCNMKNALAGLAFPSKHFNEFGFYRLPVPNAPMAYTISIPIMFFGAFIQRTLSVFFLPPNWFFAVMPTPHPQIMPVAKTFCQCWFIAIFCNANHFMILDLHHLLPMLLINWSLACDPLDDPNQNDRTSINAPSSVPNTRAINSLMLGSITVVNR